MIRLTPLFVALLLGGSCQLTFDNDLIYSCTSELDCGGGGFHCVSGVCCRATGPELCGDGRDNDCDGRVDGAGSHETCNGLDDDCDGAVDEDFDLRFGPSHCGACDVACDVATQYCNDGRCELRPEIDCHNGVDEDEDGRVDCADSSCNLLSCGDGCVCKDSRKTEVSCGDGVDSDGDGWLDCGDTDCEGQACGEGCTCVDAAPHETTCFDRADNDGNGETDCADARCAGQLCLEGTTQRCLNGACLCNGGLVESEDGVSCGDGVDNDCDGRTDCAEPSCAGLSCSADGGTSCVCVGGKGAERSCANVTDDDGDGLVDCADVLDCPAQSACTGVLGGARNAGVCNTSGQCVAEFCFDGVDNDGDSAIDCEDPDCFEKSCDADGGLGCLCKGGRKTEAHCGDGIDNDGDGLRDCGDEVDCPAGSTCIKLSNGQAGFCQAANKACN